VSTDETFENYIVYNDGVNYSGIEAGKTCQFNVDISKSGYTVLHLVRWGVTGWIDKNHAGGPGYFILGYYIPYLIMLDISNSTLILHGLNSYTTTLFFELNITVKYRRS
jgi:hypothetical protein